MGVDPVSAVEVSKGERNGPKERVGSCVSQDTFVEPKRQTYGPTYADAVKGNCAEQLDLQQPRTCFQVNG